MLWQKSGVVVLNDVALVFFVIGGFFAGRLVLARLPQKVFKLLVRLTTAIAALWLLSGGLSED